MPGHILPWMSDSASNGEPLVPKMDLDIKHEQANDYIEDSSSLRSLELKNFLLGRNDSHSSNLSLSQERIAQLTTSLRTRLTYAFVKIQNGWATHSLEQLEILANKSTGTDVKRIERPFLSASTINNRIHKQHRRFNSDLSMLNSASDSPRGSVKKNKHKRPSSISIPTVSLEIPETTEPNDVDAAESLMFLSSPHSNQTIKFPGLNNLD